MKAKRLLSNEYEKKTITIIIIIIIIYYLRDWWLRVNVLFIARNYNKYYSLHLPNVKMYTTPLN